MRLQFMNGVKLIRATGLQRTGVSFFLFEAIIRNQRHVPHLRQGVGFSFTEIRFR